MPSLSSLRELKFIGFSVFDTALAFIGVAILSPILIRIFRKLGLEIPFVSWIFFTIPIGIITHIMSGRHTPMTEQFLDIHSHYPVKIFILGQVIIGGLLIRKSKKRFSTSDSVDLPRKLN